MKTKVGKPIGKVQYTVLSAIEPVHFDKRKDAAAFKELLASSTAQYKSDIVRREITNEGYEV